MTPPAPWPIATSAPCSLHSTSNTEAHAELRRALALDPWTGAGAWQPQRLLARSGCPLEAESASRTAISLAPDQHCWLTNLGVALFSQGRHAEAEGCYRKALAMRPDYAAGHGNLLFALNYRTDLTAEAIFAEYQNWDRRHAQHLASEAAPFALDRTPGRRLRVGYVSADFRQHAVAMFAEPLLAAHDRSNVELYLYSGVVAEDATTERFRSLGDHWRNTVGLRDAKLAELIRADRIDVLVDLAGHSAGNRLLAFARRAGARAGGLSAGAWLQHRPLRHGRIPRRRRPGAAKVPMHCSASAWSGCRAFRWPTRHRDGMPAGRPLPALTNGFVTFGHFGRTERLNDDCHRGMGTHPARGAAVAAGAGQPAIPGAGIPRSVPGTLRRAWHRAGQTRPGLFNAAAARLGRPMAASTSRWIRSHTMPAPRRSRRCGRACRS